MSLSMDPRALPKLETPENAELLADYEIELMRLNEMLETFETPGWGNILESIRSDWQRLDSAMIKEDNKGRWKFLRGKADALLDVLNLPDRVQATRLRVLEDYRRLTEQEEG